METKIDKNILFWLQESKPLIINYDDTYGDKHLQEALQFLDGGDIATLNHYILTDLDNISSYKKDTITYSKIIYYANKISRDKISKTINSSSVQSLIKKRFVAIEILDDKDTNTLGYRQKFINKFDEKQTNFFIKDEPLFSDGEKEVIKLFGVNSFFDSNFNYKTAQRVQESFMQYAKNNLQKQLTLQNKTNPKTNQPLGNKNDR